MELAEEGYCRSAGGEEVEAPPAYCKWDAAVLVASGRVPAGCNVLALLKQEETVGGMITHQHEVR